ncbi:cytochrome c1 [Hyalomma marginatum]|uniref:Cytochrome c1 n=1 Tax=Hyalomma marginatum TaxID=34627 RepID=A0A8S4C4T9_9ACAR|nr:cytochrome c1 [Hyalomma marginatum]CAG7593111.1 cytochrome c1 [Hyalomma marginatum]
MAKNIFYYLFFIMFSISATAMEDVAKPKQIEWHFDGITGTFDRQSIQRGFKVFKEVCSACHSVDRLAFRNFAEVGFSEAEIKSLAAEYSVNDGPNDNGEMFERPARPSDQIPGPYANEKAARAANNGAYPPDLSLIIKARGDGANYVYSLLTGFSTPPAGFHLGENMYYNPYFAGGGSQLAMAPPLTKNGQVSYSDGTEATIEQMAKDVVNFLQWAAEPEMEKRKNIGISVMIFLAIFTFLFYLAKKRIWKNVK